MVGDREKVTWKKSKRLFGKQMFAGPCSAMGHRVNCGLQVLLEFSNHTQPIIVQISLMVALLWAQTLPKKFFRQLGDKSKSLPESLGLDCFQLEIIHMPETF